jgi:hypothetical protein
MDVCHHVNMYHDGTNQHSVKHHYWNAERREEEGDDRAILQSEDDYFVPFARLSSVAIQPRFFP